MRKKVKRLDFQVILSSASPRRQEMMHELGIRFQTHISRIKEERDGRYSPQEFAVSMATRKARACRRKNAIVIGMDTVVVLGKEILGKPRDDAEAERMLMALSNRMHRVITGVALTHGSKLVVGAESTRVYFRKLDPAEIRWYVRSREPFDKAGAYGIQGLGRVFITRIEGCYFNVVGFPVACFQRLLKRLGFILFDLI